jgi:hypothetical protein
MIPATAAPPQVITESAPKPPSYAWRPPAGRLEFEEKVLTKVTSTETTELKAGWLLLSSLAWCQPEHQPGEAILTGPRIIQALLLLGTV